ncbi:hypothetical protein Bca101_007101 [Brassica carinata]
MAIKELDHRPGSRKLAAGRDWASIWKARKIAGLAGRVQSGTGRKRDGSKAGWFESGTGRKRDELQRERDREREKAIRRYVAPVTVVSGSMMLPVSQAPSICTGGASSSHHKKFENSLSTEEEDLVPAMGSS